MTKFYLFSRYLTVLLFFITTMAWSQGRTVSGKVTSSDDGSGLPGVNILEKGTSNGTITSTDGSYSIQVSDNAVLVFSFVGYRATEITVGTQSNVDVTLEADVTALSEVVVIGYGEVKKRDATGAVASVKAEDFNRGVIASPEQLIQGKSAGVQITSASGEPGAGVNIRIRGTSSVRGGNNPLFVVDGIPLSGGEVSPGGSDFGRGGSSAKNPLNFLNPNDIESIDILKDASATAIYGSRGANGVVIITTKSGKGQNNVLEYSTSLSFSRQARKYDLLDRDQYINAISRLGGTAQDFGSNTDWQDEVNRTGVSHRHDLSYSKNYKGGNLRASVSYDDQEGIIKTSGLERLTGRINLSHGFLNDKLKLGVQGTISRVIDQAAPITNTSGFEGDLIGAILMTNPTKPAFADSQYPGDVSNPLALLKYSQDGTETDRTLINLSLGYDILPGLNVKVNTGFDRANAVRESAYSSRLRNISNVYNTGRAFINENDISSDLLEAFVNYQKTFGKSSINAVVGYSYQEFSREGVNIAGLGFEDYQMDRMLNALNSSYSNVSGSISTAWNQFGYAPANTDNPKFFSSYLFPTPATTTINEVPTASVRAITGRKFEEIDELQSYFARVNYTINERYLFTASIRADGSTRFGGNNKYGIFPSAAFAWRLSDEGFIPEFFDDLKLRLGYGVTGNQEIPHNLHQSRQRYRGLGIANDGKINPEGTEDVAFANPDLKWEQTSQLNIGLDFGFITNRLTGTLDFYRKNTTDLLMQVFSAQPAPNPFIWRNLDADVVNNGVEFTLNAIAVDNTDFGLNFGFNISYNQNTIENFAGNINTGVINGQGLSGAYAQRLSDGQPLYAYFLRDFIGYDPLGLAIYEGGDVQQFLGFSPIPKYNGGFNLSVRYKNFDVSAFLNGQFGHYIYNNAANAFFTMGSIQSGRNVTVGTLYTGEASANAPEVSTRFLEKGDFIRFQNLNIGYRFPLENSVVKNLRVYVSGQNLHVWTQYSGLDPEVNVDKSLNGVPSLGIDYTSYPRARTLTIGLSASF